MEKEGKQSRERNGHTVIKNGMQEVEEWVRKLRMQGAGWRNKNDPVVCHNVDEH